MPDIEQLERFDLNMLAMYCLRVPESPETDSWRAEQARQLKAEWVLFIGHAKPPIPGLNTPEAIARYGQELKQRLVSFLAGCSLRLTLAGDGATRSDARAKHASVGAKS